MTGDGSAGDADYGSIGQVYARYRRPEPAIAAAVDGALGSARSVCNVGAGAGSYEPEGRWVVAVEPSATMRLQRLPGAAVVVDAAAEALPLATGSVDAAMATFTVHQWSDLAAGLAEMRRVSRGPVAVLTCDPDLVRRFWLDRYAPEVLATEVRRYPSLDELAAGLGGTVRTTPVPVPLSCADGFNEAYYGRPEMLLDRRARQSCSAWSFVDEQVEARFADVLRRDLADGTWDARWGHLRTQATYEGSLVLVVSEAG